MSYADFSLDAKGSRPTLDELKKFLLTAIDDDRGDYFTQFILHVNRLFPEIDREHEHVWVGLWKNEQNEPIIGPELDPTKNDVYLLWISGVANNAPPFGLAKRLSMKFANLTFRLSVTNEDGPGWVWVGKNGEFQLDELSLLFPRQDLLVFFMRDGKNLEMLEIEDTFTEANYIPDQVDPYGIAYSCEFVRRDFFINECPSFDRDGVIKAILELNKSRTERFGAPVIDWQDDPGIPDYPNYDTGAIVIGDQVGEGADEFVRSLLEDAPPYATEEQLADEDVAKSPLEEDISRWASFIDSTPTSATDLWRLILHRFHVVPRKATTRGYYWLMDTMKPRHFIPRLIFTLIAARTNMSRQMDDTEQQERLYCTPAHITKALLKRELFPGSIWESAAGRGDIVKALRECNYADIHASDINDWGFQPCQIENSLESTREFDCSVSNPPFDLKLKFLEQAKRHIGYKFALLLPVQFEYTIKFIKHHQSDSDFPWKALYSFPQSIRWLNVNEAWGKIHFGWYVFERGYRGAVLREKILFRRNRPKNRPLARPDVPSF